MKFKTYFKLIKVLEDIKHTITETDEILTINLKFNSAKVSIYFYKDDDKTLYLAGLYVPKSERKQGLGTKILKTCESMAKKLGFKKINLWVKRDSWVQKWYESKKYKNLKKPKDDNYDWMVKKI